MSREMAPLAPVAAAHGAFHPHARAPTPAAFKSLIEEDGLRATHEGSREKFGRSQGVVRNHRNGPWRTGRKAHRGRSKSDNPMPSPLRASCPSDHPRLGFEVDGFRVRDDHFHDSLQAEGS